MAAVQVRVRLEALDELAAQHGLATPYALAKRLGVAQPTVRRILDGGTPGEKFIAAVIAAFGVDFGDVFEVVDVPEPSGGARGVVRS